MFGYIRPLQGELKVRELERFKACYCGLCHTLGKKYGVAARFILNYELVFLSMLLWDPGESPVIKKKRCMASPCRRKRCCDTNRAFDECAGYSVILTWWKLKDTIADEPFFISMLHRMALVVLFRAYRKASRKFPEFDNKVRKEIACLAAYESSDDVSIDGAADKFAKILRSATPESAEDSTRRPMAELLYHLGRWIYVIDACDDYVEDAKGKRYNPVMKRYPPDSGGALPEDGSAQLKTTLTHSNNLLCLAFELLPENTWSDIVRNVIYLSMPETCERILPGAKLPNREMRNEN